MVLVVDYNYESLSKPVFRPPNWHNPSCWYNPSVCQVILNRKLTRVHYNIYIYNLKIIFFIFLQKIFKKKLLRGGYQLGSHPFGIAYGHPWQPLAVWLEVIVNKSHFSCCEHTCKQLKNGSPFSCPSTLSVTFMWVV